MASTGAQRRRRRLRLLASVAVLLAIVAFVHDVLQTAHASVGAQTSLNRTFGVLANSLIDRENELDRATVHLWYVAPQLDRTTFLVRYEVLSAEASALSADVARFRLPGLADGTNNLFMDVSKQRLEAWGDLRSALEGPLGVSGVTTPVNGTVQSAVASVRASNASWAQIRRKLANEPGHVTLHKSRWLLASSTTPSDLARVLRASSLRVGAGTSIDAVLVLPQPLPSSAAQIVLLPNASFALGVSVRNATSRDEVVTLHVQLVPLAHHGPTVVTSLTTTVKGLSSYAFNFPTLPIVPDEQATLHVWTTGGAPAFAGATNRVYSVKVAPGG